MMEQWPYGANILIESTSCNFSENIGIGREDFITSRIKNTKIIYQYTEINGTLYNIETNLKFSNWNKTKKTFTLETDATHPPEGEKPYIHLLCDNVRIPMTFINHDTNGNKWATLYIGDNDISVGGGNHQAYVKVAKEIIVNWSKTTTQQIFKGIDKTGTYRAGYLACDAFFLHLKNNKIESNSLNIWSLDQDAVPVKGQKMGEVTIPALNGKEKTQLYLNGDPIPNSNLYYYKYFILGVQIMIYDGYTVSQFHTMYYIGENDNSLNKTYDNTTFSKPIKGKYYLKTNDEGFPIISTEKLKKWNTDFFFIAAEGNESNEKTYYVSPSTSELFYEYIIKSEADSEGSECGVDDSDQGISCACGGGDNYGDNGYCDCGGDNYGDNGYCDCGGGDNYGDNGYCDCGVGDADEGTCICGYLDSGDEGCYCGGGDNYGDNGQCDCGGGGGTSQKPWEENKVYTGGSGHTVDGVWIYDEPGGSRIASMPNGTYFAVYYYWNGWFEIGDGWIRSNAPWDYISPSG